ncbi:Fungal trans [Geosmithia morbida]|uniref:Fungal trans n=1 Tax=Geosmithia morbida TaxID=1094350 RepID=A0A9P4YRE1_9HYPO|nr:Fungal trans [Geosmithia morbida]KAF4120313.1 Fungal trans [Geosmithia morbida]
MSEDDGGLPAHEWTAQVSPANSDSEHEQDGIGGPDGPSQPIQKRRRSAVPSTDQKPKECTYDKPSNRRRNPAPQYIEALEGRLQRAENLLRKFVPDVDLADPNLDPAIQQEFHNREQARARAGGRPLPPGQHLQTPQQHHPPPSRASQDAQLVSMIDSTGQLDLDDKGGWDFQGRSSGSVFLRRMKEHFRGKLGPSTRLNFLSRPEKQPSGLTNLDPPTPAGASPFSSTSTSYTELPSREVARNLCYYSLSCATCLERVVHVPSFYDKLDKIYDRPIESLNQEESHFMALVYSVLALGCMYNSLDDANTSKMAYRDSIDEGVLLQDITDCRDLTSLQALVFTIFFMQASSNLSACYAFVGIALRSALRMGLHRHLKHSHIDTIEDETRRRVFYVIRQMDIYVSTLLGFPLLLSIEDIDQPYPSEVDDEYLLPGRIPQPQPGATSFFVAFNAHTRLMEILAKITKYVYPMNGPAQGVKSSNPVSSYSVSYSRIKDIEADLHSWYEQLPEHWRPSPDGSVEVVRVRHLLRFIYAHVQLVLYRPFLHYVSPRLGQGTKVDELSYACAAAAISVSRNIVHIGLEIRKQRVLSGPYWFMLYTEFFAVLSLVFYAIENPEKPGSAEVLADAWAGRRMIAELADRSLSADRVTESLQALFDQLPEKPDTATFQKQSSSKKRSAPPVSKDISNPMFPPPRQSSVGSQRTDELSRARQGGRTAPPPFGTPSSQMVDPRIHDPGFATSMDLLGYDMSSRATSGSPSTASSSHPPSFPVSQQQHQHIGSQNAVNKLDNLMFPSADPFAYPNQPMMELNFQQTPSSSTAGGVSIDSTSGPGPHNDANSFFMTGPMDDVDSQLLGQPPPYMMQQPDGHPGMGFPAANMYDPGLFSIQMGGGSGGPEGSSHHPPNPAAQQPPPPHPSQVQHQRHHHGMPSHHNQSIHPAFAHPRRPQPRQAERQMDQIFTENGMQADWGSFFGSGRGVFQGM